MFFWSFLFIICVAVHHVSGAYRSCKELREDLGVDEDGIFHLRTRHGMEYQTFCDMTTAGGGWTLVASVHENNVFGKCTVDDRWSSQQGKLEAASGDGSWQNRNTFGTVEGATCEDFKNPGYYDIEDAENLAVWHVPNVTPACEWKKTAIIRYRTTSGIFGFQSGNLYNFFKDRPVEYDSGKSCEAPQFEDTIQYDYGNDTTVRSLHGPNANDEFEPGWISLKPVNTQGHSFALCSGVKPKEGKCNVQHYCIGGGGYTSSDTLRMCGDFSAFDWSGYGTNSGWSASKLLTESSVLIFYR